MAGMRAYTVHAPPGAAAPERYAFVKDGIAWPALFVPVLWILWHRLWLTLVWYVVLFLVIAWTERLFGDTVATILAVLTAILFALEANNIRRLSLQSRGWREVGSSFGANLEEAELRYFEPRRSPPPAPAPMRPEPAPRRDDFARDDDPIFGLFPEPER